MNSMADTKWGERKEEYIESKSKSCQKRFTIVRFSILSYLKSRKFLGKIRTAFEGITSQPHKLRLAIETSEYKQKSWDNTAVHKFVQGIRFQYRGE